MYLILCVRFPGTILVGDEGSIAELQNFLLDSKLYEITGRVYCIFLECILNSWHFASHTVTFQ